MNDNMMEMLIPIVAILSTFGFPVAMVFIFKWFKLRERELQVDSDFRKESSASLEARVQRLESVLLQLDPQLRAPGLLTGPPAATVGEETSDLLPLRRVDRNG
jgi:hypothetical protein